MPKRPCLDCGRPASGARCPRHERAQDRARGTRQQRGYGAAHDAIAPVPLDDLTATEIARMFPGASA